MHRRQHHSHEVNLPDREKVGGFIVFEGIDGSGKGAQIQLLEERLVAVNRGVWVTKEPTDGPEGLRIRAVLRGDLAKPTAEEFQCHWYTRDREGHQEEIEHHLRGGFIVLCDRYYYSTIAYGVADKVSFGKLWSANQQFLRPGLTLWLRIPPAEALKRIDKSRSRELFENDLRFQGSVHRQYELMASRHEFNEIVTIDANQEPDRVASVVQKTVASFLRS